SRSGDALTLLDSYGDGLSRLRLYPVARLCSRRGATSHCAQHRHSHTNDGAAHALLLIRGTGACKGTSDPCLRNHRSVGCFRCTGSRGTKQLACLETARRSSCCLAATSRSRGSADSSTSSGYGTGGTTETMANLYRARQPLSKSGDEHGS